MIPFWTLGFVCLIIDFSTAHEPAVGENAASKNHCSRKDCNGTQYDIQEAACCENKLHPGSNLFCCGKEPYNPATATCCKVQHGKIITASITQGLSEKASKCCDLKAYNPVNEICCQSTIISKPGPMAECCGKDVFDKDKQLCCGPADNKTILVRNSRHHECCGHSQYDTETQCCCSNEEKLEIQSKDSSCCVRNFTPGLSSGNTNFNKPSPKNGSCGEGMKQKIFKLQPKCTEPNTHLCGSSCYNPKQNRCCESNHKPHSLDNSGQRKATATVYNPHTQVCCDGRVSPWKPWIDQCCGETPYGSAQRGVLCCNKSLYEGRDDGEECSEMGIPYNPAKGTMCCSQFHGSPGQHCCGIEIYQPHTEICCNGHRHLKSENIHCCGVKAYNIKDPQMKCCAGTLYNLTSLDKHGGDAQCCGSILQKPQDICCSNEDKEVLYSAKTGFRCCGHLYYNTTLWSCCAGGLRRIHEPGQDQRKMINGSRLLSVDNLNKIDLCKEMHIGTVESVSLQSIVFRSVLKVHGMEAKVKALPLPYILERDDRCSSPKLIAGKTYYFNKVNVFIDFNHDSVLQSLHFIISKCS
ncbi:uncharacterized protein LOC112435872 isoform X1 [Maylandia zebra]|uniref:uncharacterized protein LOC112435872 isoform X1 n=1 Tax=Maylandia zebra TaxID=106582 RepID=UPI000D2FC8E8|nr:uncharacterized protein LOC112435872 isoform X1 [Maylandia zebra]